MIWLGSWRDFLWIEVHREKILHEHIVECRIDCQHPTSGWMLTINPALNNMFVQDLFPMDLNPKEVSPTPQPNHTIRVLGTGPDGNLWWASSPDFNNEA